MKHKIILIALLSFFFGIYTFGVIQLVLLIGSTFTDVKNEDVAAPFVINSVNDNTSLFKLTNVEVTDGDTITATIELPWDISIRNQSIRALGFDAFESTYYRKSVKITPAEIVKGKLAKEELINLLNTGDLYVAPGSESRDNYGRILAFLIIKNSDGSTIKVDRYMVDKGHDRNIAK